MNYVIDMGVRTSAIPKKREMGGKFPRIL